MLLEADRLEEAERYFLAQYPVSQYFPPAQFYLGRIYEEFGDTEKAIDHYRIFAEWWKDADPELQPWRAEAVEAIRRLSATRA